jgi:hypothetical protein
MPDALKDNLFHFPPVKDNEVRILDNELQNSHQIIEQNVQDATQESMSHGSSIPAINTNPMSPLSVIQGADHENVMTQRESEIDATMPDSFKKPTLGFVGKIFGSGVQKSVDHLAGLDANRYGDAVDFNQMKQKKAQEQAALNDELKKAA